MGWNRAGVVAAVTAVLASSVACTAKAGGPATLPPLTASGAAAPSASASDTSAPATPTPTGSSSAATPTPTVSPSATATTPGGLGTAAPRAIPSLSAPTADPSVQAALATARAFVWSKFAIDYNLDARPLLAVTTLECQCQIGSLQILQSLQRDKARGYGALPANVTAVQTAHVGAKVRATVSYDAPAEKEVDAKGKVFDSVKPKHVVFDALLVFAGGRWRVSDVATRA